MTMSDPQLRAEYAYLVRGFLRLATQFEQDMEERKVRPRRPSKTAAWWSAMSAIGPNHHANLGSASI